MVAAALIGAHVNLEVIAQGIRHDRAGGLGGGHIEVVDKDAAQVIVTGIAGAPKGMGVGQADEIAVLIAAVLVIVERILGDIVQGVVIVGGGIGGLLDAHGAAGLGRVLAHHVQIDAADDILHLVGVRVQVQAGEGHLVAPHEDDGALRTGDLALVNELLHLNGQLQIQGHAGGVVVAAGLLDVSGQDHTLMLQIGVGALDLGDGGELSLGTGMRAAHLVHFAHSGHVHLDSIAPVDQGAEGVILVGRNVPLHDGLAGVHGFLIGVCTPPASEPGGVGVPLVFTVIPLGVPVGYSPLRTVPIFRLDGVAEVGQGGGGHHGDSTDFLGEIKVCAVGRVTQQDFTSQLRSVARILAHVTDVNHFAGFSSDQVADIARIFTDSFQLIFRNVEAGIGGQMGPLIQVGLGAAGIAGILTIGEDIDPSTAAVLLIDPAGHLLYKVVSIARRGAKRIDVVVVRLINLTGGVKGIGLHVHHVPQGVEGIGVVQLLAALGDGGDLHAGVLRGPHQGGGIVVLDPEKVIAVVVGPVGEISAFVGPGVAGVCIPGVNHGLSNKIIDHIVLPGAAGGPPAQENGAEIVKGGFSVHTVRATEEFHNGVQIVWVVRDGVRCRCGDDQHGQEHGKRQEQGKDFVKPFLALLHFLVPPSIGLRIPAGIGKWELVMLQMASTSGKKISILLPEDSSVRRLVSGHERACPFINTTAQGSLKNSISESLQHCNIYNKILLYAQ